MPDDSLQASPVALATELGWSFADLYCGELPAKGGHRANGLPSNLPGAHEHTPHERAVARAALVDGNLRLLGRAAGVELTQTDLANVTDLGLDGQAGVKAEILAAYTRCAAELAATHPRLAKALGLGRMLRDTAFDVDLSDAADREQAFNEYRLRNAFTSLSDLQSELPDLAAGAVATSLRAWQEWLTNHSDELSASERATEVATALNSQGETWRRLLSGARQARRTLEPSEYIAAAQNTAAAEVKLVCRLAMMRPMLVIAATVLAVVGATVAGLAPGGWTDHVLRVLLWIAGTAGLSWTALRSTVKNAALAATRDTWEAELARAVGVATTILPQARQN